MDEWITESVQYMPIQEMKLKKKKKNMYHNFLGYPQYFICMHASAQWHFLACLSAAIVKMAGFLLLCWASGCIQAWGRRIV